MRQSAARSTGDAAVRSTARIRTQPALESGPRRAGRAGGQDGQDGWKGRMAMTKRFAIAVLCLTSITAHAQWVNYRVPGVPRTSDGKVNLTAPVARTPDGKPDLSGT